MSTFFIVCIGFITWAMLLWLTLCLFKQPDGDEIIENTCDELISLFEPSASDNQQWMSKTSKPSRVGLYITRRGVSDDGIYSTNVCYWNGEKWCDDKCRNYIIGVQKIEWKDERL